MLNKTSHRRLNILIGEWVLVSPHRMLRPWQGKIEEIPSEKRIEYDKDCYLCPGNIRANGEKNPDYDSTFVFNNDFSALKYADESKDLNENDLLVAKPESGICRVICFSPKHHLTLAEMGVQDIIKVIHTWQSEYSELSKLSYINYIQIFENKGELMGCSNPHPHGQIWAQESIPVEPQKEERNQSEYLKKNGKLLLIDYLEKELKKNERIIYENNSFVVLVPYWAVWPFETIIIPKRKINRITDLEGDEVREFAEAIKIITVKYDNIFRISFPYSAGIHQAPTDGKVHEEWQFHMHFYPPLLRSATVKKFMVGYEMLANPQRDLTAERSAEILFKSSIKHFKESM